MRIPLSDPEVSIKTNSLRQVSNIATSYYLMAMIQADDQFEYRKYATMLRNQVMPKQENKDTYLCVHPEWFDRLPLNNNFENSTNEHVVDSTTCSMCGFSNYCTLGIDRREFVTIQPLDHTSLPAKDQIMPLFTFDNKGHEHIPTDPFVGFSHHAGSTRNLYIAKLESIMKKFPTNKKYSSTLKYAIGYDRESGRVLWPLDQIFLEFHEKLKKNSMLDIGEIYLESGQELTLIDEKFILDAAADVGWLKSRDTKRRKTAFLSFFSAIIDLLKNDRRFLPLRTKGHSSMTPGVEHGFSNSGSGFAIIGFIWMMLRTNDFEILIKNYNRCEELDFLTERIIKSNYKEHPQLPKYLPRYPALALIPKSWTSSFKLESPIFRVINGVEYDGNNVLLIIDSLGTNFDGVFKNG